MEPDLLCLSDLNSVYLNFLLPCSLTLGLSLAIEVTEFGFLMAQYANLSHQKKPDFGWSDICECIRFVQSSREAYDNTDSVFSLHLLSLHIILFTLVCQIVAI